MNNLPLRSQNFDKVKHTLKDFSNYIPKTPQLQQFKEVNFFGWSKNVEGKDMNEFVAKIQQLFIESNNTVVKIIKEFKDIYNVFEVLDNEYIKYFQSSIDNLLIVSDKAQKAGNDALNAQKDIDRTIQALKLTIEKLSEHKIESAQQINTLTDKINLFENDIQAKLIQLNRIDEIKASIERFKHFMDIDQIWEDVQKHKSEISTLIDESKSIANNLVSLNSLKDKIERLQYIDQIDNLWLKVENLNSNVPNKFSCIDIEIEVLKKHKNQLDTIIHLIDVDKIWDNLNDCIIDIKDLKNQQDAIITKIEVVESYFTRELKLLHEKMDKNQIKTNNKVLILYFLSTLCLSLFIFLFFKS